MDIDLDLAAIEEAARIVDRVFRDSPQFVCESLCAALGRTVLVKIETANPLGSFKGRGADFLVRSLPAGSTVVWARRAGTSAWPWPMPRGAGAWAFTCTFPPASTRPGERGWKASAPP